MTTNRPQCPACRANTKKNGTTSKGTTRWRCTHCGHSFTRSTQNANIHAATFRTFINWTTNTTALTHIASTAGISISTLRRRLRWCWLIHIPHTPDPHRIYDQIFLDGTYLAAGCLLIAADRTHVINWHWCRTENTHSYTRLIENIAPPEQAVIDGGKGAYTAITTSWKTTRIQRCLVHIQRTVRRHTTSRPRTDAGKALYRLALALTRIKTTDHATEWALHLHEFSRLYKDYLAEKTYTDPLDTTSAWAWTHPRSRTAHNALQNTYRRGQLFAYLQPSEQAAEPKKFAATTNTLEGGINAGIKHLARAHRGLSAEHQRTVIDWWLYLKTQEPDDPVQIARSQKWGQDALAKAQVLLASEDTGPAEDGRPAIYDTAIDTTYNHSMGIQKGWAGT